MKYKGSEYVLHCAVCLHYAQCPLASPSPGPPGMSGWLMGLWDVHVGEEGSSPTSWILLCLPRLGPSCSWIWHTASAPSPLTHSWSASWWASSGTFSLSPQTPWCSHGREVPTTPLILQQMMSECITVFSFTHVVLLWQDGLWTHTVSLPVAAITQVETCQGQGQQSDRAQIHKLSKSLCIWAIHTHTYLQRLHTQIKCLLSRGKGSTKKMETTQGRESDKYHIQPYKTGYFSFVTIYFCRYLTHEINWAWSHLSYPCRWPQLAKGSQHKILIKLQPDGLHRYQTIP